MPLPSRVVDYFVLLSVPTEPVSSSGRFKQVGAPLTPCIRYPHEDHSDAELPKDLGAFSFPNGARFESELSMAALIASAKQMSTDSVKTAPVCDSAVDWISDMTSTMAALSSQLSRASAKAMRCSDADLSVLTEEPASATPKPSKVGKKFKFIEPKLVSTNPRGVAGMSTMQSSGISPLSVRYSFVLTEADGTRVHCQALRFYSQVDLDTLQQYAEIESLRDCIPDTGNDVLFAPFIMVLCSHWPFYAQMQSILDLLFDHLQLTHAALAKEHSKMAQTNSAAACRQVLGALPFGACLRVPLEKILQNIIAETPLPPMGRRSVRLDLSSLTPLAFRKTVSPELGAGFLPSAGAVARSSVGGSSAPTPSFSHGRMPSLSGAVLSAAALASAKSLIEFSRPPPNSLPMQSHSLCTLFRCLSMDDVITLMGAVLCEKRVLFFSEDISVLSRCMNGVLTLIYPFYWQHIFVPVLPMKFIDFLYAPMPFLCGVLPEYMPDLALLEGVVFVNLDKHCIQFHQNDPIPPFPRLRIEKYLTKIVRDWRQPLKAHQPLDEEKVRDAFIRFWAKFLRSYKKYMNPSSGFGSDKFNKEAWVSEQLSLSSSVDEMLGMHETEDSGTDVAKLRAFYEPFVESQLFLSFVEERWESASEKNYEVLFFDEKIDEVSGGLRSTPFLSDSTFSHDFCATYCVPPPTLADLAPSVLARTALPVAGGCDEALRVWHYADGFPLKLDRRLLGKVRTAKVLVSDRDLLEQQTMHISWMSLEFFKKKRLYDRQWHSIGAQIDMQNWMFAEVSSFLTRWMSVEDTRVLAHTRLAVLFEAPFKHWLKNNTSFKKPWLQMRDFVNSQSSKSIGSFKTCKQRIVLPLVEDLLCDESDLKILRQAAKDCELHTAKSKCEVELRNKARTKWLARLEVERSQADASNPRSVAALASAIERSDKAEVDYVEATTQFLTELDAFTSTMPMRIKAARDKCRDRLKRSKDMLTQFVQIQRKRHMEMVEELDGILCALQQVDPESDMDKLVDMKQLLSATAKDASIDSVGVKGKTEEKKVTFSEEMDDLGGASSSSDDERPDIGRRFSISRELSRITTSGKGPPKHMSIDHLIRTSRVDSLGAHLADDSPPAIPKLAEVNDLPEDGEFKKMQVLEVSESQLIKRLSPEPPLATDRGVGDEEATGRRLAKQSHDLAAPSGAPTEELRGRVKSRTIRPTDAESISRSPELAVKQRRWSGDEFVIGAADAKPKTVATTTKKVTLPPTTALKAPASTSQSSAKGTVMFKARPRTLLLDATGAGGMSPSARKQLRVMSSVSGRRRVSVNYYSDNMWGPEAFTVVVKQNQRGRDTVKAVTKVLDDFADVFESYSKSLGRCYSGMKSHIDSSKIELDVWRSLQLMTNVESLNWKNATSDLKVLSFGSKVLKSDLKRASGFLQHKKIDLANDLQSATKHVNAAYDTRTTCQKAYLASKQSWKWQSAATSDESTLLPLIASMKQLQLAYLIADDKWETAKRLLKGTTQKKFICNGVILDTFREKEIHRQYSILKALAKLADLLFRTLVRNHGKLKSLYHSALQICADDVIDDFVVLCNNKTSPVIESDRECVRWNVRSVELVFVFVEKGRNTVKALLDFMQARHGNDDSLIKHLGKKSDWKIECEYGYELNGVLEGVSMLVQTMSKRSVQFNHECRARIESALTEVLKRLLEFETMAKKMIAECNSAFRTLEERLGKSVVETNKLEQSISSLRGKLEMDTLAEPRGADMYSESEGSSSAAHASHSAMDASATVSSPRKKKKKKRFGHGWFRKSKEQLKKDLALAETKYKVEIQNRDTLKAQLQQKAKFRDTLFAKVVTDFLRYEKYRVESVRYVTLEYVFIMEKTLVSLDSFLFSRLICGIRDLHVLGNISSFVELHRIHGREPPKVVCEHTTFKCTEEDKQPQTASEQMARENHGVMQTYLLTKGVIPAIDRIFQRKKSIESDNAIAVLAPPRANAALKVRVFDTVAHEGTAHKRMGSINLKQLMVAQSAMVLGTATRSPPLISRSIHGFASALPLASTEPTAEGKYDSSEEDKGIVVSVQLSPKKTRGKRAATVELLTSGSALVESPFSISELPEEKRSPPSLLLHADDSAAAFRLQESHTSGISEASAGAELSAEDSAARSGTLTRLIERRDAGDSVLSAEQRQDSLDAAVLQIAHSGGAKDAFSARKHPSLEHIPYGTVGKLSSRFVEIDFETTMSFFTPQTSSVPIVTHSTETDESEEKEETRGEWIE